VRTKGERREEKERKREKKNERKKEKERGRKSEAGWHSKEREEESSARVEAADEQTLRDPQAGVFELRPLCRLPFCRGREKVEDGDDVGKGVGKSRREREKEARVER